MTTMRERQKKKKFLSNQNTNLYIKCDNIIKIQKTLTKILFDWVFFFVFFDNVLKSSEQKRTEYKNNQPNKTKPKRNILTQFYKLLVNHLYILRERSN